MPVAKTGRFCFPLKELRREARQDSPELEHFFHKSIIEAIVMAGKFFEKKKIPFVEADYLAIIEEMKRRLKEQ